MDCRYNKCFFIIFNGVQADWQVMSLHLKNGSRRITYRMTVSFPPKKYCIHHDDPYKRTGTKTAGVLTNIRM